jgi:hypothetical protein
MDEDFLLIVLKDLENILRFRHQQTVKNYFLLNLNNHFCWAFEMKCEFFVLKETLKHSLLLEMLETKTTNAS